MIGMGEVNRWTTKLEEVSILVPGSCSIVFIYANTGNRKKKKKGDLQKMGTFFFFKCHQPIKIIQIGKINHLFPGNDECPPLFSSAGLLVFISDYLNV